MGNRETPLVLAVLVLEDLVMAGFLPLMTVLLVGGGAARVGVSAVAALLVGSVLAIAWRFGSAISRAVFSHSDEALLLGLLGILLLTAGATEALNVSAAVGAFLAGIVFSGPAADRARSLVVPLRSVFAAVFFVFFGFQVDPGAVPGARCRRCCSPPSVRSRSSRPDGSGPRRAASVRVAGCARALA